ncbi:MAG: hypothetical protein MJ025_02210, partial [Victivallaceae bacterium]|nr:hypothetical protein [Victivallaceae bacterium]
LEFADSAFMSGLGSAMFSIGMIAGRLGPAFVFPQKHLDRMLLTVAFAGAVVGLAIILACHSYWLICVALFFIGLFSGPLWPSSQSLCCDELNELDSNIIFIVLSCAGIPGASIFTWIVGATADIAGLRLAMLWTPICYGIYIVLIRLAMRRKADWGNLPVR